MRLVKLSLYCIILASAVFGFAQSVQAEPAPDYVPGPDQLYTLEQKFGNISQVADIGEYIQLVYSYAVGIVGIIAVVLIMGGGIMWVSAAGNEQKISTAKEVIVSAVTAVIIMVLSYGILVFINPQLTKVQISVPVIPVLDSCPEVPLQSFPSIDGLESNGSQACPGMVAEITSIVSSMRATGGLCEDCTLAIGNAWRSSESQATLYQCFTQAVEEGYRTSGGIPIKDGCPSGCSGCNKAREVSETTCASGHLRGAAMDAYLMVGATSDKNTAAGVTAQGPDGSAYIANSRWYLNQKYNLGNGVESTLKDPLKNNQDLLATIATSTGKFTPFTPTASGGEWWHFDFSAAQCDSFDAPCTINTTTGFADNGYCRLTTPGSVTYTLASCTAGEPTCPTGTTGSIYTTLDDTSCGLWNGTHLEMDNVILPPNCVSD